MVKQINQRFDFADERLKFFSSISPYSFNLENFRKLLCSFKFLLGDKAELQERVYADYEIISRTFKAKRDLREDDFDIEEFWINLFKNDQKNECVKFVILLLCLPKSNACVERIFSAYNLIKTDIRNSLDLETIEAIIRVKEYLKAHRIHSDNLRITDEMIKKFNTQMYKRALENSIDN